MKLVSWNVNGLRACWRKGFANYFAHEDADIVSLQEVRAFPEDLTRLQRKPLPDYQLFSHPAKKSGYAGVATYSRVPPKKVTYGMGYPAIDDEGRVLMLEFDDFTLINTYMPHSRRDLSRLDFKMRFLARFSAWIQKLRADGHKLIICGDYNTAHSYLDLTNDKANKKAAGFLPQERLWFSDFLATGFRDVFRDAHPGEDGHHTWWSNRKGVRERNVGWRIDYHCVDHRLVNKVTGVAHRSEVLGSDHCPVVLEGTF